jgi:hypothetical protein
MTWPPCPAARDLSHILIWPVKFCLVKFWPVKSGV